MSEQGQILRYEVPIDGAVHVLAAPDPIYISAPKSSLVEFWGCARPAGRR